MKNNPYNIVRMFEEEIARYTGSPYAVSVDSCTNATFLCCKYLNVKEVIMPKRTYLSIPMSVIHAGGTVKFKDIEWSGIYRLDLILFTTLQRDLHLICILKARICVYLFTLRNY